MSNDPTKIYDDKLYTFPEDKTKENVHSSGNRWASRWTNRWASRWGNQFTENQEEIASNELNKPLPKMTYEQFTKKYQDDIENIRTGLRANGNYHLAVIILVQDKYGIKYFNQKFTPSQDKLKKIFIDDKDKGKGTEYMDVAKAIAEELNTVGSDWHNNLIAPYQDSLIKKQEQYNKERKEEATQQWKEKRIEDAQNSLTHDNYAKQSSQIISQNAEILSYEAFVSKYKDAIEGRAKSLEKKNQYSGATAELVATMQIAKLVYGVELYEIKNKDGKVESYHYQTQISLGIQKKAKEKSQSAPNYKKASQDMRNAGEVMKFYWNTGICMDERYDDILMNSKWLEKAQDYRNLRETKMDTLRANQREERTNTMREKYEHDILEIAKNKELKKKLSELRKSKMREAMVDLGFCLLGVGITLASGGVGALIGQPLVLLLEADEIIGASRVLLTSNDELDPEKEYKIIKGQFVEWGGKAGDDAYERIAFFLDGKSILSSYLQRNPDKSTISGMSLINLLEEAQDRKDKFDFVVDIKDKVSGEEEKKDK